MEVHNSDPINDESVVIERGPMDKETLIRILVTLQSDLSRNSDKTPTTKRTMRSLARKLSYTINRLKRLRRLE